ncbi:hypothetical protein QFZ20_000821 [Flavobacterium sp. W4I14]|nr:hypothetical protein [Flavobacterium sp. W4I14]
MKVIMIHGRDQQGQDPSALKKTWIDTFEKGLTIQGLAIPSDLDFVFPFYGDLLDGLIREVADPATLDGVIAKGDIVPGELSFYYDLVNELAEQAGVTDAQISEHFKANYKERGVLNWEWVQSILKVLDRSSGMGDFSVRKFTYDVFMYLTVPAIRKKINEFVLSAFNEEPSVVIGHSLGSVVGYDVLRNNDFLNVKKYITIGSPLGVKAVRSKLTTPLVMPECIESGWYNAYDERDFVALKPLDERNFSVEPSIVNSNHVKNQTDNRHGIEGYLNDAVVAKEIYDALGDR